MTATRDGVASGFEVGRRRGTAAQLLARAAEDPLDRAAVWVCEVTEPALVLGSAQNTDAIVDMEACAAARIEVITRRSGGGAVLLAPGDSLWVDVVVPATHEHHEIDVDRSFLWFGETWARAMRGVGFDASVVTHPQRRHLGRFVCFAGLGHGEVVIDDVVPRKVVGVSQRRSRAGARLSSLALLECQPEAVLDLVRLPDHLRDEIGDALGRFVGGLDRAFGVAVLDRLLADVGS